MLQNRKLVFSILKLKKSNQLYQLTLIQRSAILQQAHDIAPPKALPSKACTLEKSGMLHEISENSASPEKISRFAIMLWCSPRESHHSRNQISLAIRWSYSCGARIPRQKPIRPTRQWCALTKMTLRSKSIHALQFSGNHFFRNKCRLGTGHRSNKAIK